MIQEKILKIATALSIEKDGKVDTGKKRFQYRKLEDIRMSLKPLLVKNKVFYKPNAIRQNDVLIFQVCFCDVEDGTKECYECPIQYDDHPGMSREQASGAALTYAEKYLLAMVFMLDDGCNVDPDSQTNMQADSTAVKLQFEAAKRDMLSAKTVEELFEKFRKYPQFKDSAELKKFGATLKEKIENGQKN